MGTFPAENSVYLYICKLICYTLLCSWIKNYIEFSPEHIGNVLNNCLLFLKCAILFLYLTSGHPEVPLVTGNILSKNRHFVNLLHFFLHNDLSQLNCFIIVNLYYVYILPAIVIKPSNIRIWIHDKDMGKLSRVLWEGQGNRLRTEVSSNKDVKRFLEAVPYVMVRI